MLVAANFVSCVQENLKAKGYGQKRIKEITNEFEGRMRAHEANGKNAADAGVLAMTELFENMSRVAKERVKRNSKMLAIQAENIKRVQQGADAPVSKFLMDGKKGSRGTAVARAAVSLIEGDPRFAGQSYASRKEAVRGQFYAMFGNVLDTFGKGAFARQRGKAHLPNVARELGGESTGDAAAKTLADSWNRLQDYMVDVFNAAGGSMNKLANYLPQSQNGVKMVRAGKDNWVKHHLDLIDWNKTRWPDGSAIPAADRQRVLENVFDTITTDGASKIDMTAFRGKGSSVGNKTDNHRFLHYKDGTAWLEAHEAYGEGNVFDVMVQHIERMSHDIALLETFGPSPEMSAMNLKSIVRAEAAKHGAEAVAHADAVLKNKFDPMFEVVMRQNAMDPHSNFGAFVTGVGNILTSAQLGSASILAIPGDFVQTAAVRALNNMGMFNGVSTYLKGMTPGLAAEQRAIATQSGFIMDEVVMSTYAQSRWTGMATVGPQVTRMASEAVMRASLMSGHTKSARWAAQSEFMGLLHRSRDTAFEQLPFRPVMERYGITAEDWDAMRALPAWEPKAGVKFMRPLDAINGVPNGQALYHKFHGMIGEEAKKMVPESTIEGAVSLRNTTRPDTLVGSLLYSFSMYKNFPISFAMIYGRLGMTSPSVKGRLGFYAGLGAGMTLVGAVGTQLREISQGRDPMPMDTPEFMGKAMLSGGALSIWGDFLFSGINSFGQGPGDIAAGPLVGWLGDTTNLLAGDVFQFASSMGSLSDKEFKSTTASRAVEYARRYTPGQSVWWARLALQRAVFDRLQEIADPKAYQKWRRQQQKQKREKGNEYWWAPGQSSPSRAPQF